MPEESALDPETGHYVYAVVPAVNHPRPSLRGIDEAEVRFVEHREVAAAVAVVALDRPPGRRAELLAHSAVVDALAATGPVVPVQFGSILADADDVVDHLLGPGHDHYADLLGRLRGTTQLRLQGTYVQDRVLAELVACRPDVAELRRRTRDLPPGTLHPDLVRLGELVAAALDDVRASDTERLLDAVHPLVVAVRVHPVTGLDRLLDASLLVEEACLAPLEARLEAVAEAEHERIRLSLSTPMAPYDFVEGDAWD